MAKYARVLKKLEKLIFKIQISPFVAIQANENRVHSVHHRFDGQVSQYWLYGLQSFEKQIELTTIPVGS